MTLPKRMPPKSSTHKIGNYQLTGKFPGYHAREDPTTLPPGTLISPSQNVVIKTSGRVSVVEGYKLDGATSAIIDSGILSHFDFTNFKGNVRNLRAGFLTAALNDGKLQYRYVTGTTVNWVDLVTGLTNVRMSYCEYWDNTALVKNVLWVDGTGFISAWNGAVTTFASATGPVTGVIGTLNTTPTAGGTGYVVGDLITISGGTGASARVTTIGGGGAATVIGLVEPGTTGYTVASGIATTGGSGTGCTVQVTATVTASTITKQGTTSWAQEGFAQNGNTNQKIIINGTSYTYTGSGTTGVLMGVTTDPTLAGYSAGAIIHQAVVKTALSAMTSILATFLPTVIGCGRRNQVYVGSSTSNVLYISKVNNYLDYSFTLPVRVVGEGCLIPLDSAPTKFIPQEVNTGGVLAYDMYISEGTDTWGIIRATLSSDLTKETLEHIRLKVAPLQAAKSERLATKMKNEIMFVGNDNTANFMGLMSYQFVPAIIDFSTPIIDDMKSYDFTDASIFYHRNYVYIAIPKANLVRIYNMTDQTQQYTTFARDMEDVTRQPWFWEAPVTYSISGFYVVAGEIYGHSYTTSESYKLFTGGSFNGQDIDANATFSYDDKSDRTQSKASTELWIEGYIKQNTTLSADIIGDLDAAAVTQTVTVVGTDASIVAYGSGAHALGKNPLGSQPLGGAQLNTSTRPAWFHVAKTYNASPFYLEQLSFYTKGVDLQWELIDFGTNAAFTAEGNNDITQ